MGDLSAYKKKLYIFSTITVYSTRMRWHLVYPRNATCCKGVIREVRGDLGARPKDAA